MIEKFIGNKIEVKKHECNNPNCKCNGSCGDKCKCKNIPKDDEIIWARVSEDVKIPTKTDENAGYDVYAYFEDDLYVIPPHTTRMLPTGLFSAFDNQWVAVLHERGSNGSKGIAQRCGVIDASYRGEWMIPLTNTNDKAVIIAKEGADIPQGDYIIYPYSKAVCQVLMLTVPKFTHREISVEELQAIPSERGNGKLGSSGK